MDLKWTNLFLWRKENVRLLVWLYCLLSSSAHVKCSWLSSNVHLNCVFISCSSERIFREYLLTWVIWLTPVSCDSTVVTNRQTFYLLVSPRRQRASSPWSCTVITDKNVWLHVWTWLPSSDLPCFCSGTVGLHPHQWCHYLASTGTGSCCFAFSCGAACTCCSMIVGFKTQTEQVVRKFGCRYCSNWTV